MRGRKQPGFWRVVAVEGIVSVCRITIAFVRPIPVRGVHYRAEGITGAEIEEENQVIARPPQKMDGGIGLNKFAARTSQHLICEPPWRERLQSEQPGSR